MIWRCFGKGLAATLAAYLAAMFLDQVWPLGSPNGIILVITFIGLTAWWGASRTDSLRQGALHGALTILAPAALWTVMFNALQYSWGGARAMNIDHLYYNLFLLGVPLALGSISGAVIGYIKGKAVSSA